MPIAATTVVVTTGPTPVVTNVRVSLNDLRPTVLRNDSGVSIFLGGSTVAVATGLTLPTGSVYALDLGPADDLYAIVNTGTAVLQLFQQRV